MLPSGESIQKLSPVEDCSAPPKPSAGLAPTAEGADMTFALETKAYSARASLGRWHPVVSEKMGTRASPEVGMRTLNETL